MARSRRTELDIDELVEEDIFEEEGDEAPKEEPVKEKVEVKEDKKPSKLFTKKKIIIFGSSTFILISVVIGFLLVKSKPEKKIEKKVEEVEEEPVVIPPPREPIGDIPIISISPFFYPVYKVGKEEHFLKISISAKLSDVNLKDEIDKNILKIRDNIFTLIRRKKYKNFDSEVVRNKMRKEVKNSINMVLQTGVVLEVYFTELIII